MRNSNRFLLVLLAAIAVCDCTSPKSADKEIPAFLLKFDRGSFASPVGPTDYVSEANDIRDDWYNAQDFGENNHLGEDWNKNTGGDTDCGEPVYSTADGVIVSAKDAGPGWGNVIIVEHVASDGTKLRSVYGHLATIERLHGVVRRRERLGTIGNAGGRYKCHLHFEIRWSECPVWDEAGPGYSGSRHGWIDPSEFIEKTRLSRQSHP